MILNELFSNAHDFYFTSPQQTTKAKFSVGGEEYTVFFEYHPINDGINVSFALDRLTKDEKGYNITGTGNAVAVFSTVIAIIKDYITRINPQTLSFTAESSEPSRMKLYDRMVTNMAQGWEVQTKVRSWGTKVYTLINPNANQNSGADDWRSFV